MCIHCDGASRDEGLFHLHTIIERDRWAVQGVEGDGPHDGTWAYTIGLVAAFGHPELVVLNVRLDAAHALLEEIASKVAGGVRLMAGDEVRTAGGRARLGRVHPAHLDRGLIASWVEYYLALGPPVPVPDVLQVHAPPGMFCCEHHGVTPSLADPMTDFDRLPVPAGPNRAQRRAEQRRGRRGGSWSQ